jgi:hypothetical protein
MKRVSMLFVFLLCAAAVLHAEDPWAFKGTVVRMRMGGCIVESGGFRATMSGSVIVGANCPEYTVMSSKVVYVVVGRRTEEFIPLAEDMDFLIRNNQLIFVGGDEKNRSRFVIQQMVLREDWDREQELKELEAKKMERSVSYEVRNPPHAEKVNCSR